MAERGLAGRTLGQYILHELVGAGGYGAVYRGEQPVLERDVVIKVLHERRNDSESRERFLREAIADRDDRRQVVVVDHAHDLARTRAISLRLNYPELPDGCLGLELPLPVACRFIAIDASVELPF